jgi:hypothetical protein
VQHTVLATIKGIVGPAILYMPKGFAEGASASAHCSPSLAHLFSLPLPLPQGGWVFGVAMLAVSYGMWAFGISRLVASWRHVGGGVGYGQLAAQAYGPRGRAIVQGSIVLQQCGIAVTYVKRTLPLLLLLVLLLLGCATAAPATTALPPTCSLLLLLRYYC